MTFLRRAIITVAIIGLAAVGLVGRLESASSAAAPTVYNLTYAGTDAHSFDPHLAPMFVNGGGVEPIELDATTYPYLEIGQALPVGAKVTSVSIHYLHCNDVALPVFTFGSFSPSTLGTQQLVTITGMKNTCKHSTITKVGNPITTIAAGRRYVIDEQVHSFSEYPGTQSAVWYGTTVKYTCTAPCAP